jgi:signal peptidase I
MSVVRSILRPTTWVATATAWLTAGLCVGVVLALIAPMAVGWRPFTVLSGSMEPAISTGDVVLDERIEPMDVRLGDVVTFRDPEDSSRLITHRVLDARARENALVVVTKGDANNTSERWSVPLDGEIGRVAFRVPALGYMLAWTHDIGPLFLIAIPALLLAGLELVRIWRPARKEVPGEAPA